MQTVIRILKFLIALALLAGALFVGLVLYGHICAIRAGNISEVSIGAVTLQGWPFYLAWVPLTFLFVALLSCGITFLGELHDEA
jgi:hypothetical protein